MKNPETDPNVEQTSSKPHRMVKRRWTVEPQLAGCSSTAAVAVEPLAVASLAGADPVELADPSLASFPSLEPLAGAGGGAVMWGGGVCFSFNSKWRILERSVGFPGLGPWMTVIEGFLSLSFFPFFSIFGTSRGMSSPIVFQYCLSASLWNFSWLATYSYSNREGHVNLVKEYKGRVKYVKKLKCNLI